MSLWSGSWLPWMALAASDGPSPRLPVERLVVPSAFDAFLQQPSIKALLPVPILCAIAPVIWWFFRDTWKRLDEDATDYRAQLVQTDRFDPRPLVCLALVAVVLTLQEYYGGRTFYDDVWHPWLEARQAAGWSFIQLARYDELYGYAWWVMARLLGYVAIPFPVYKLLFPKDSLLDLGLRIRGFSRHLGIYAVCLGVVLPAMLLVASQPDFGTYYPFYKHCSRSGWDWLLWELMYSAQFFGLEMFFRGFIVGVLRRSMGTSAIFAMAVPYCMIHYGKPYLEVHGAIVAGVVLGSLAARTRSIYAGFLVHVTVAWSMDILALYHRNALPTVFWPG